MAPYRTHFDYCDKKIPTTTALLKDPEAQNIKASLREVSVITDTTGQLIDSEQSLLFLLHQGKMR